MSTSKHFDKIVAVVLALALIVTVLFCFGERLGMTKIVDEDAQQHSDDTNFTTNDRLSDWDTDGATVITLTGDGAEISGDGAYVLDGGVVIASAGSYVLRGTLTDGSVTVDTHKSSKVWLLLDGVSINCSDDACLRVDEADKVFLTLAEGSENVLVSGESYSETALADGAIFAHDDLTINGTGALTVTAAYKHGIAANDDLVIAGGVITVTAVADGIRANDSMRIADATITVNAGDDGLVVDNDGGYLYVESGTFALTTVGDAIHTAGDITIDGGTFAIATGDDGIHSDTNIVLNGGEIVISECYEGIEAITITQNGGDVVIYPSDDGVNANGGSGGFGNFGGFGGHGDRSDSDSDGERTFTKPDGDFTTTTDGEFTPTDGEFTPPTSEATTGSDAETYIRITGGTLTVINPNGRDADGLDSNGSIYIEGGTVLVSLVGSSGNCALDYGSESGGELVISGGTVIACGDSSMVEEVSDASAQASILWKLDASASGALTVADASGNALLSWDVPCSFNAAIMSSPSLTVGETVTLTAGTQTESAALESVCTTVGSGSGGFGGFGGFGGNKPSGFGGKDKPSETQSA